MPKYFSGERQLPHEWVVWTVDEISEEAVAAVFAARDSASFCLRLPGLPHNSLGYVVNVQSNHNGFDIIDITYKKLISLNDEAEVVLFLKHASGIESDDSIREQLLRVRDASA